MVRNFPTHGQLPAAQGSLTSCLNFDFAILNLFEPSAPWSDGPEVEHWAHFLILYYHPLAHHSPQRGAQQHAVERRVVPRRLPGGAPAAAWQQLQPHVQHARDAARVAPHAVQRHLRDAFRETRTVCVS